MGKVQVYTGNNYSGNKMDLNVGVYDYEQLKDNNFINDKKGRLSS
jgi:hypothetical protein